MTISGYMRSMAVRIFALLAIGMSLAAAVGFFISDHDRRQLVQKRYEDQVADRILDVVVRLSDHTLSDLPAGVVDVPSPILGHATDNAITDALTHRLAGTAFSALQVLRPMAGDCSPEPGSDSGPDYIPPLPPPPPPPLARQTPPLPQVHTSAARVPDPPDCRLVSIAQAGAAQRAVMVPIPSPPPAGAEPLDLILFYVLIAAAVVLAFVVALLATAPIRDLARAASRLGDDLDQPPLAATGPSEVRQAAEAFNLMQARIRKTVTERTFMLAAITHDLQTPLTRQRLRIERLTDPVLRDQMLDDYRAMRDLIRDGLDIARGGTNPVLLRPLDLASMLESLCEDAIVAGQAVVLEASLDATVLADPVSLQRCLVNLVENAVKYGQRARVSAVATGDRIEVRVNDDGPGIDIAKLGNAVQPFVRLEQDGMVLGTGLGLAIARLLAERNGSDLTLTNLAGGGLCASIRLALAQGEPKDAP